VIDLDVPETELEVKGFPPGTQIYLNGKLIGTVVVKRAQFRVKCGQYEAVLKHPIYGEWRQKIEVRPGESFILETLSEEAE
jgi:translation initiation factor IF-1